MPLSIELRFRHLLLPLQLSNLLDRVVWHFDVDSATRPFNLNDTSLQLIDQLLLGGDTGFVSLNGLIHLVLQGATNAAAVPRSLAGCLGSAGSQGFLESLVVHIRIRFETIGAVYFVRSRIEHASCWLKHW